MLNKTDSDRLHELISINGDRDLTAAEHIEIAGLQAREVRSRSRDSGLNATVRWDPAANGHRWTVRDGSLPLATGVHADRLEAELTGSVVFERLKARLAADGCKGK